MSRDVNDPRLAEVLAVFDRFASSWTREHKYIGSNMLDIYMAEVVLDGHHGLDDFPGWTDRAMRAVLIAYLRNAPISALAEMHRSARRQLKWLLSFEKEAAFEHATGVPYRARLAWGVAEAMRS